jgi:hypothetical protein
MALKSLRGGTMPLFQRGSHKLQSGDDADSAGEETNGKSTETGDAYWYWTPIEVDPIPIEKGLSDIVPLAEQRAAVKGALDSFGTKYTPELREAMRVAWYEIMGVPLPDPANGTGTPR